MRCQWTPSETESQSYSNPTGRGRAKLWKFLVNLALILFIPEKVQLLPAWSYPALATS
jgi:hypothetical protein